MIAKCKNCGLEFKSRIIHAVSSMQITVSGSEECPKCGYKIIHEEQTYDFDSMGVATLRHRLSDLDTKSINHILSATAVLLNGKYDISDYDGLLKSKGINVDVIRTFLNNGNLRKLSLFTFVYVLLSVLISRGLNVNKFIRMIPEGNQYKKEIVVESRSKLKIDSAHFKARREYLKYIRNSKKK